MPHVNWPLFLATDVFVRCFHKPASREAGRSLVMVRTGTGREFIDRALDIGIAELDIVASDVLPRSQESLYRRDLQLFGRLMVMRMLIVPRPEYKGFFMCAKLRKASAKVPSLGTTASNEDDAGSYSTVQWVFFIQELDWTICCRKATFNCRNF